MVAREPKISAFNTVAEPCFVIHELNNKHDKLEVVEYQLDFVKYDTERVYPTVIVHEVNNKYDSAGMH